MHKIPISLQLNELMKDNPETDELKVYTSVRRVYAGGHPEQEIETVASPCTREHQPGKRFQAHK
jgi:hypothetical protein